MMWTMTDFWIVAAGALAGMACAISGSFLVLRRMSMMGDAISHAVLPGIALAFVFSQTRGGFWMLLGAILAGVLSAVLTQLLHREGEVEEGASMGVVFTLMFAAGLLLMDSDWVGKNVDLDLDCVLFGVVELVPLSGDLPWMPGVPAPVARLIAVLAMNIFLLGLFYKEWKLSSFDPALSDAVGISANRMHYLLMVMTAVTSVYCFEIVGSILVIAMLIVPAACARMLTDRLLPTLLLAMGLSVVFAVAGHAGAMLLPGVWGYVDTSSSGGMAVAAGLGFLLCVVFAPRHGLLRQRIHRRRLALRTLEEDLLGALYRHAELDAPGGPELRQPGVSPVLRRSVLRGLRRKGLVTEQASGIELTHKGFMAGAEFLRRHRLWEEWLHEHTATAADHLHDPAEALEHVTDPGLRERLAGELRQSQVDPSGRRIPGEELEGGETVSLEAPESEETAE